MLSSSAYNRFTASPWLRKSTGCRQSSPGSLSHEKGFLYFLLMPASVCSPQRKLDVRSHPNTLGIVILALNHPAEIRALRKRASPPTPLADWGKGREGVGGAFDLYHVWTTTTTIHAIFTATKSCLALDFVFRKENGPMSTQR